MLQKYQTKFKKQDLRLIVSHRLPHLDLNFSCILHHKYHHHLKIITLLILLSFTLYLLMAATTHHVCAVGCQPGRRVKYFCSME